MFFSTKADAPESDGGGGDQSQEPNQYEDEYEEQPVEKNQDPGEQVQLLIKFVLPKKISWKSCLHIVSQSIDNWDFF